MMMMSSSMQGVTKKRSSLFLLEAVAVLVALFLLPSLGQASMIERDTSATTTTLSSKASYSSENGTYTGSVKAWGNRSALHHTGNAMALKNQLMLSNKGLEVGGTSHSPVKKLVFSLSNTPVPAGFVRLELDGLYGVSTAESHALGQQASTYTSSPTTLKINGVRFQHFTLNTAETITVDIPVSLLKAKGFNIIQLEAGYFFDENDALAYDEVSTGSIRLSY